MFVLEVEWSPRYAETSAMEVWSTVAVVVSVVVVVLVSAGVMSVVNKIVARTAACATREAEPTLAVERTADSGPLEGYEDGDVIGTVGR